MDPGWLGLLGAGAAAAAGSTAFRRLRRGRARRRWEALGRELELTPCPPTQQPWALQGRNRGVAVEVVPVGGAAVLRALVEGPLPPGLWIARQKPQASPARLTAMGDIRIGEAEVDRALLVLCENPAGAIRLLRAQGAGAQVAQLLERFPESRVVGPEVQLVVRGEPEPAVAREALSWLARAGLALQKAAQEVAAQAAAQRRQSQEDLRALPARRFARVPFDQLPFEQQIRHQFRRRVGWARGAIAGSWVGVGGAMVGLKLTGGNPLFVLLAVASTLAAASAGSLARWVLRCPACDQKLPAADASGVGHALEATHCTSCGVRLR